MSKKKWLDFSPYNAEAVILRPLQKRSFYLIKGLVPGSEEFNSILSLKNGLGKEIFKQKDGENGEVHLYTDANFVPLSSIHKCLPNAQLTEVEPKNVLLDANNLALSDDVDRNRFAESMFKDITPAGTNYHGDTVYLNQFVRAIHRTDKQGSSHFIYEDQLDDPAAFFRLPQDPSLKNDALDLCAQGLNFSIAEGKKLRSEDILGVLSAIYEVPTQSISLSTDPRASDLLNRVLLNISKDSLLEKPVTSDFDRQFLQAVKAFEFAPELFDKRPQTIVPKKYADPAPMVMALRSMLSVRSELNLSLFVSNSPSLTALSFDASKTSFHCDNEMSVRQSKKINPAVAVVKGDWYVHKFGTIKPDVVVVEPELTAFKDNYKHEDLSSSRVDFLKAYKALLDRNDLGVGLVKLCSLDSVVGVKKTLGSGKGVSSIKDFVKFVGQRFEVLGFAEIHHSLLEKAGASFSNALIVVGERRPDVYPKFSITTDIPQYVPEAIRSWEDVNRFASSVKSVINSELIYSRILEASADESLAAKSRPEQLGLLSDDAETVVPIFKGRASKSVRQSPEGDISKSLLEKIAKDASEADSEDDQDLLEEANEEVFTLGRSRVIDPFAERRKRSVEEVESYSYEDALDGFQLDPMFARYADQVLFDPSVIKIQEEDENRLDRGKKTHKEESSYQSPTKLISRLKEPASMVPRNLVGPMSYAADQIRGKLQDIDLFVGSKLRMTQSEMSEVFSGEQIDAIGLAILRAESNKGFILADQTGLGKGRVIAGLARYSKFNNIPFMFITEKAQLFSDFFRDLKDIKSDHLFKNILTINDDSKANIYDEITGELIYKRDPIKTAQVFSRMEANEASLKSNGVDLCFATYSQFRHKDSIKTKWMKEQACRGAFLAMDESHNASGQSTTAEVFRQASQQSHSAISSSATYAKNAKSLAAYSTVFPDNMSVEEVQEVLEAGGEPASEIVASMLAADGSLWRREHDLSKLKFETKIDTQNLERNSELADMFSEILLEINRVSGKLQTMSVRVSSRYERDFGNLPEHVQNNRNPASVESMAFGSTMYNLQRVFALCLKADFIADQAIEVLRNNEKPVIVLEQTQESMLRQSIKAYMAALDEGLVPEEDLYEDIGYDEDGAELPDLPENERFNLKRGFRMPPVTMRNALMQAYRRAITVKRKEEDGAVRFMNILEIAQEDGRSSPEDIRGISEWMEKVETLIMEYPDLTLLPIDHVRNRLVQAGYKVGEVTGRKFQCDFEYGEAGDYNLVVRSRKDNRISDVRKFNNGELDAMILNIAGASGISLHSNRKFRDIRKRVMVEWQIANDVNKRVQLFGRVNRKGQVSDPTIRTASTGLPFEMRMISMQKAKLRELSANTQANRRSAVEDDQTIDLMNRIGNECAREYLISNPDIAELLGIDMDHMERLADNTAYINKLGFLISLLYVEEQIKIFQDLEEDFQARLRDYEMRGENPLKTKEYDWKAKCTKKELFLGAEKDHYDSSFDRPVYASHLEFDEYNRPVTWDKVVSEIEAGRRSFQRYFSDDEFRETRIYDLINTIEASYTDLMVRGLRPEHYSSDENPTVYEDQLKALERTLNRSAPPLIKEHHTRLQFVKKNFTLLVPGTRISIQGGFFGTRGIVVGLKIPPKGQEHLLGKYDLKVMVPGDSKPTHYSLATIATSGYLKMEAAESLKYDNSTVADDIVFDSYRPGVTKQKRIVLTGNLFNASRELSKMKLGSPGVYTDENGVRVPAIILRKGVTGMQLQDIPVVVDIVHAKKIAQHLYGARLEFQNGDRKDDMLGIRPYNTARQLFVTYKTSKSVDGWKAFKELESLLSAEKKITRFQGISSAELPFEAFDGMIELIKTKTQHVLVSGAPRDEIYLLMDRIKNNLPLPPMTPPAQRDIGAPTLPKVA